MTIRFATYLSPNIYETYAYIAHYVEKKVGQPATLMVGQSFNEIGAGPVDIAFMCGLPYSRMAESPACPFELLAAPVLLGERYQHRPIYFSDMIVRRDSAWTSFDDLRGCAWAYNQRESHSGWNIVCYSLLARGRTLDYFGKLIETGSHQCSISAVLAGQADAAAIDSQVLDALLASDRAAAAELRVIDMLGPSSIPPLVIARTVNRDLKCRVRQALLAMHEDPRAASALRAGAIERFVGVRDEDYQDIRDIHSKVFGCFVERCSPSLWQSSA